MHSISPLAKISPLADLEDSTRGSKLVIGARVVVDAFVKIKFAGGLGNIEIGEGSYLNSGVVIYSGNGVTLGSGVLVAANTTFAGSNHEYRRRDATIVDQRFMIDRGGIIVEDDVWIGANCVILEGAIIRRGSVIGACTFVNEHTQPYSVNVGTPARCVGFRA